MRGEEKAHLETLRRRQLAAAGVPAHAAQLEPYTRLASFIGFGSLHQELEKNKAESAATTVKDALSGLQADSAPLHSSY